MLDWLRGRQRTKQMAEMTRDLHERTDGGTPEGGYGYAEPGDGSGTGSGMSQGQGPSGAPLDEQMAQQKSQTPQGSQPRRDQGI